MMSIAWVIVGIFVLLVLSIVAMLFLRISGEVGDSRMGAMLFMFIVIMLWVGFSSLLIKGNPMDINDMDAGAKYTVIAYGESSSGKFVYLTLEDIDTKRTHLFASSAPGKLPSGISQNMTIVKYSNGDMGIVEK